MNDTLRFPIVGIGASAGGVEALDGFFRGVPDAPNLAFVVVTHLGPKRHSLLHEIVARYTNLPVKLIDDNMLVERNTVYVLPSDVLLEIEAGRLKIHTQDSGHRERKPIDLFFSSLAQDQEEFSVGVILSGGDSDGTLGAKAIKGRGGLTLAQVDGDESGPQHSEMPESAISAGLIDLAIPVEQMGSKLADFAHSAYVLDEMAFFSAHGDESKRIADARNAIYSLLRSQVGHDFSGYKTKTFVRRVQRRMQVRQVDTLEAYIEVLRKDSQEVSALFRDLLINVTSFFRDADAFDQIAKSVIPALFDQCEPDGTVRIWVPGCATGEEVYSLGILLLEHLGRTPDARRVQIFATDIDEHALAVARAGRYPPALLEGVSTERRNRFFVSDAGSFLIAKEVRDLCIFSPHSVIRDPPFSRIDLVSCRNLLIYFGLDIQAQVIPTFHYALKPGRYLFLGTSESVSQFDDLFTPIEKKHRIFRRRSDVAPHVRLPLRVSSLRPGHTADLIPRRPALGAAALRQTVDAQVLERFAPPHVLVNRDGDIAYYSARTGKYLEPAAGVPTRQIFTMARKGLRLDLRTVFREAVETGRTMMRNDVAIEDEDGRVQLVNLTVEPLHDPTGSEPMYLILFADQGPVLSRDEAAIRSHMPHDGTVQTERELRETRERLQSIIEEYETALEELKSSNEELVSVNEELQSANEELEASKEELVSLNEELHTVNTELNGKIEALDRANDDLQNLFDSTAVATVFLDRNLVIRSYTPAMTEVFNIRPGDCGRPITDLSSPLNLGDFHADIASAMSEAKVIERQLNSSDGTRHYMVRLAPYRVGNHKADGVVAAFVDVTNLTRAEDHQRVLIAELQHRTRNLLGIIASIAVQTLPEGARLDAFTTRLGALGRLQGLLGKSAEDGIEISDVVRLEIETLAGAKADKLKIDGPPVSLAPEYLQTIALVMHELATNAVKYGALKIDQGQLVVTWHVLADDERTLVLDWKESGLETPPESTKRGYGRQLIEKALAYSHRAKTELEFEPDGVRCHIEIPLAGRRKPRTDYE